MYSTTGFSRERITDLCTSVHRHAEGGAGKFWPPILGLFKAVVVTLVYMRRNRVQQELAETYGVSQPTISRAICGVIPVLEEVLGECVPTAEDLDEQTPYVVDGTLLPCWSWASHPQLHSGKHKTTGMNVQVACTLAGRLAWISDPIDGNRHDSFCLSESGVLLTLNPGAWIGDKGYAGKGMLTPVRKPRHRELLSWEKEFNSQVNRIRYVIERTIANFKTWRILHTDYRRPIATFTQTMRVIQDDLKIRIVAGRSPARGLIASS